VEEGTPSRIKLGVFFAGWPPVEVVDGKTQCVLASEFGDNPTIDIPTCHIVGCNDPWIHGAISLFNICDESAAILFDHGKGHTIPRDASTIKELAEVLSTLTSSV
jgi:hypothetical protein